MKNSIKVTRIIDGEGFEVKDGEKFRFGCCDCGLTHDMIIVKEDNGKYGVAVKRNLRATSARRRYNGAVKFETETIVRIPK